MAASRIHIHGLTPYPWRKFTARLFIQEQSQEWIKLKQHVAECCPLTVSIIGEMHVTVSDGSGLTLICL